MRYQDIEKILIADGWIFKRCSGSHFQFIHPIKSGKVTVPHHHGDLDIKTARSIFKQANINYKI